MLMSFRGLLDERRTAGAAAGAFTCYDVTSALGVVQAAEACNVPVMFLVAEASLRAPSGRLLLPALLAVGDAARVPVCVQLDHVADDALVDEALAGGIGAVMADGSKLPEDENASFVAATGCDCLAVSIGNVHGHYAAPPQLDWDRLAAIREHVHVPLSLHGASGLPDDDVRRAIALGISKVNVNTELRERYLAQLEAGLPAARDGLRLLALQAGVIDAVAAVVAARLAVLG